MTSKKIEKEVYDKFQNVIEKNFGFKTLGQISQIYFDKVNTMDGIEII